MAEGSESTLPTATVAAGAVVVEAVEVCFTTTSPLRTPLTASVVGYQRGGYGGGGGGGYNQGGYGGGGRTSRVTLIYSRSHHTLQNKEGTGTDGCWPTLFITCVLGSRSRLGPRLRKRFLRSLVN